MRLLHLFEEITKLNEAATDRYMQMFTGIFNALDQLDQLSIAHAQQLATDTGISKEAAQVYPEARGAEIKQNVQEQVNWAVSVLGRADRITWWLRWYKIWVLQELSKWGDLSEVGPELSQKLQKGLQKDVAKMQAILSKYPAQLDASDAALTERVKKLQARTRTEAGANTDEIDKLTKRIESIRQIKAYQENTDILVLAHAVVGPQVLLGPAGVGQKQPNLQHFMQMATMDQGIANLRFENQTPGGLNVELSLLEDEWRDRMGRFIPQSDVPEGAEVLIEYPDGSHWIDLHQRDCDAEAAAMGHCGNVAWGRPTDNVLSYRQPETHAETGESGWVPRMTFILDLDDGYLGEMKGYKNQKPSPEYHDKVVDLLKLDMIKGIKGGGHAPENNFRMSDLDEDVAEALMKEKPNLATLSYTYEMNDRELDDTIFEKINHLLDEHGIANIDDYNKNDDLIIHEDAGDAESVYNGYSPHDYDSDFYGNVDEFIPDIIKGLDDETVRGLRHYVIETYNALPEDKIPDDVRSIDTLTFETVMDWDREGLFDFLKEEMDDVHDVFEEAIKIVHKDVYENNVVYAIESIGDYGMEDTYGSINKRDDGKYQVVIDKDDFMDNLVPKIEAGEKDNKMWHDILNIYMEDVSESMAQSDIDNEWMIENIITEFEKHEDIVKAINLGITGVTDPHNEFQQEFDFGELQLPPKPRQPEWSDYDETDSEQDAANKFHSDLEKYKKDIKTWTNLVKKYGGEEHASA